MKDRIQQIMDEFLAREKSDGSAVALHELATALDRAEHTIDRIERGALQSQAEVIATLRAERDEAQQAAAKWREAAALALNIQQEADADREVRRAGQPYHPFASCTKGCGFEDGHMVFCDQHQPEALASPQGQATETWWIGLNGQGQIIGAYRTKEQAHANTNYVVGIQPQPEREVTVSLPPDGIAKLTALSTRLYQDGDVVQEWADSHPKSNSREALLATASLLRSRSLDLDAILRDLAPSEANDAMSARAFAEQARKAEIEVEALKAELQAQQQARQK